MKRIGSKFILLGKPKERKNLQALLDYEVSLLGMTRGFEITGRTPWGEANIRMLREFRAPILDSCNLVGNLMFAGENIGQINCGPTGDRLEGRIGFFSDSKENWKIEVCVLHRNQYGVGDVLFTVDSKPFAKIVSEYLGWKEEIASRFGFGITREGHLFPEAGPFLSNERRAMAFAFLLASYFEYTGPSFYADHSAS